MPLDIQSLLILLLIGAIAGWLAGTLIKGYGFGLIGNIVVVQTGHTKLPGHVLRTSCGALQRLHFHLESR